MIRPTAPDFAAICRDMQRQQFPLLGELITPTTQSQGNGFVPHEKVVAAAQATNIPDKFVPKVRNAPDAFRRACKAIEASRDFRKQYIMRKMDLGSDKVGFCVLNESDKSMANMSMEARTVQTVYYDSTLDGADLPSGNKHTGMMTRHQNIITAQLAQLFGLYRSSLSTADLSGMVADLVRDHALGCQLRRSGGVYYIPKTEQTGWPLNKQLGQIQAFCKEVAKSGGVSFSWLEVPVIGYEEIQKQLGQSAQKAVQKETNDLGGNIREIIQNMRDGKKVRNANRTGKLDDLIGIRDRAMLYKDVLKTSLGTLDEQLKTYEGVLQKLITGKIEDLTPDEMKWFELEPEEDEEEDGS